MLQHVPQHDCRGFLQRRQHPERIVATSSGDPALPCKVLATGCAHLDRADAEASVPRRHAECACAGSDLDQVAAGDVSLEQREPVGGGGQALRFTSPARLSIAIELVIVVPVITRQISGYGPNEHAVAGRAPVIGKAFVRRGPVAVAGVEQVPCGTPAHWTAAYNCAHRPAMIVQLPAGKRYGPGSPGPAIGALDWRSSRKRALVPHGRGIAPISRR